MGKIDIPQAPCEHRFAYAGLRYADGGRNRPGSGAKDTYYGHAYFCEKCLTPRIEGAVSGDRNSYQERLPSSAPASDAERKLLVPSYDQ